MMTNGKEPKTLKELHEILVKAAPRITNIKMKFDIENKNQDSTHMGIVNSIPITITIIHLYIHMYYDVNFIILLQLTWSLSSPPHQLFGTYSRIMVHSHNTEPSLYHKQIMLLFSHLPLVSIILVCLVQRSLSIEKQCMTPVLQTLYLSMCILMYNTHMMYCTHCCTYCMVWYLRKRLFW